MSIYNQWTAFSIIIGQATVVFGEEALEAVLSAPKFAEKYPALARRLKAINRQQYGHTVLPGEVVFEIAGQPACRYDFYTDEGKDKLYAILRGEDFEKTLAPFYGLGKVNKVPVQQALLEYGIWCLFKAADVGIGYKNESGPSEPK